MLSDNISGHWSTMQGTSGFRMLDRSGRGYHATLSNFDGSESEAFGIRNKTGPTLRLGSPFNKFLDCGNVRVVEDSLPFAVAAWFRANSAQDNAIVAKSLFGAAANRWWVATTSTAITANGPSGTGSVTASFSTSYVDGNFHHVVATYYGTSMRLYYDGIFRASATITQLGSNTNRLLFGKYNDSSGGSTGNTFPLNGWIAEATCFQSILPDASVWQLFQAGPGWYEPSKPKRRARAAAAAFNRRRRVLTAG